MHGFQPKTKRMKSGGMVRGPGTGTSDSIKTTVPAGAYIMPADSTEQIGAQALGKMGKNTPVPVALSNGEFNMSPDQVHGVGVQTLNQMKDATHAPVDPRDGDDEMYFANGGGVRDPRVPAPIVMAPVQQGGEGGGLGKSAVMEAIARQAAAQAAQAAPAKSGFGFGSLIANPLTRPDAILAERERRASFADGGLVDNDVLRVGNSYSGMNVGGNINVNGAAPMGAGPQAVAAPALAPAAPVAAPANPFDNVSMRPAPAQLAPIAPVAANVGASTPGVAAPAAPLDWQAQKDLQNLNTSAKSNFDTESRRSAQAALGISKPAAPAAASLGAVTPTPPERKPIVPLLGLANGGEVGGFGRMRLAKGGTPEEELRKQQERDRAAVGSVWSGISDANQNAGRAMLDVASMVPRGLAGAYDSAVIRPMRAAGVDAAYLSPRLVPDGVDPASMTPFTDQKRMRQPAGFAPSAAGGGRGFINPPAIQPSVNAQTAPITPIDKVPGTVVGPVVAETPTGSVREPVQPVTAPAGPSMIASQQLEAPQARGFQAPTLRNSGNDWQAANDLRNLRVSASSITNRPEYSGQKGPTSDEQAYAAALATDNASKQGRNPMAESMLRELGSTQRADLREQGDTQRNASGERIANQRYQSADAIAREELGLKREAQGFQSRAAAQGEQLRSVLLDPNSTAEQKKVAQQSLIAISGKEGPTAKDRYITVGGGQEVDPAAGMMRNVPQQVFDSQTQQFVQPAAARAPAVAQQFKSGQIYTDANGKRAKFNGKDWEPL